MPYVAPTMGPSATTDRPSQPPYPLTVQWGLCAAGVVLTSLALPRSTPGPPFFLPGLLVWVPLVLLVARSSPGRAAQVCWVQGVLSQSVALGSLPGALAVAGGLGVGRSYALTALLVVFEGGKFGVVAYLASRSFRNGWPLAVVFPLVLVTAECFYPMCFPWTTALFIHDAPILLQTGELGGPMALPLLVGFIDANIALAWANGAFRGKSLRNVFAALACLVAMLTYGYVRLLAIDGRVAASPSGRLGIVQGNVGPAKQRPTDSVSRYQTASRQLLASAKVNLLIWPETTIASPTEFSDLPRVLRALLGGPSAVPSDRIDSPLLVGMVVDRPSPESPAHVRAVNADGTWKRPREKRFNSAVLATERGEVGGIYEKRSLVAFGEYLPGEQSIPWLRRLFPAAGGFSPGASSAPLVVAGRRIATLICFEDILADRVLESMGAGEEVDLIVDLTSDAWFDGSRVPALHLALARLRAVEHRRFLVHATNTGVTAVVDPAGRIVTELPPNQEASTLATIHWMREGTVYERVGRSPALLAAILVAMSLLIRRPPWEPRSSKPSLKSTRGDAGAEFRR